MSDARPLPVQSDGGERWWVDHRPLLIAYGLIVVLVIAAGSLSSSFVSPGNLRQQLVLASFLGTVAAGQTIVILTGGIDLSVAWNLNFAAILLTQLGGSADTAGRLTYATIAALSAATAVGVVNGLGVAFLRIPPLVMTLGMNAVLLGLTLVYTNGSPQGNAPEFSRQLAIGRVAGIPYALMLWLVLSLVMIVLLRRTVFGRRLYAIGNNPRAAYLSGVPVRTILVTAYALCGFAAGLTGILLTGYSSQSYLGMGDTYVLPSIASVVIGGTSILGGSGGYTGTIAGAITVVLLQNTLSIVDIGQAGRSIIYGLVILAMLFAYGRGGRIRE